VVVEHSEPPVLQKDQQDSKVVVDYSEPPDLQTGQDQQVLDWKDNWKDNWKNDC
jgi:hypothetical protein